MESNGYPTECYGILRNSGFPCGLKAAQEMNLRLFSAQGKLHAHFPCADNWLDLISGGQFDLQGKSVMVPSTECCGIQSYGMLRNVAFPCVGGGPQNQVLKVI